MNGQMTPMQMIVASQRQNMARMQPRGLLRLPIPEMEYGSGPRSPGAAIPEIDRDGMIRDYMRTQGMDPDDPKNAAELERLKKDFGFMDALRSAPARGMQTINDAGKSVTGILDMMK